MELVNDFIKANMSDEMNEFLGKTTAAAGDLQDGTTSGNLVEVGGSPEEDEKIESADARPE
jgi:hypothetical protein